MYIVMLVSALALSANDQLAEVELNLGQVNLFLKYMEEGTGPIAVTSIENNRKALQKNGWANPNLLFVLDRILGKPAPEKPTELQAKILASAKDKTGRPAASAMLRVLKQHLEAERDRVHRQ